MNKTKQTTATKPEYTGSIPNTPFQFIWQTSRPHLVVGLFAVLVTVVIQALGASFSLLVGNFVEIMATVQDLDEQLAVMYRWSFFFFGYSCLLYFGWRLAGLLVASFVIKQNVTAYQLLIEYITLHSHGYFSNRFAGSVSNKLANASDGSARLLEGLLSGVLQQTVIIITAGLILFVVHPWLTAVFFFFVMLSVAINYRLVRWRRKNVIIFSKLSSKLRGDTVDLFTNIQATRQYTRTNDEVENVSNRVDERAKIDLWQWQQGEIIHTVSNVIALLMTATLLTASYLIAQGGVASVASMVIVMIVTFRVSGSLAQIGDIMNRVIRFHGEVEEGLVDILIDHEIRDKSDTTELKVNGGQINWKNVTFEFGNNTVFDNFDLEIKPGQRVGLVGPSGAGKTTFVSLLLRQHNIPNGAIEIDGQNIAQVTQDSLRANIAVVPQEPLLFHRSIHDNIAYGNPDATQEEIEEVAKKAQAHDFIMQLEEGYGTMVGERGIKLSGGQKQRVAIARAMLKNAPILVLDEATSALDSESEVEIQKALHILMEGKTVIAVAHRLSTLREMDRILVLDAGKIIEDGKHDELARSGGTYQKLWEHQAGGFLTE